MHKSEQPTTFLDPQGRAVTVQTHTLTEREGDVVEVRDLIAAEMQVPKAHAAMLVVPALHPYHEDPSFVEWMTCGVMTYRQIGTVGAYAVDPAVAAWAEAVISTGKVW